MLFLQYKIKSVLGALPLQTRRLLGNRSTESWQWQKLKLLAVFELLSTCLWMWAPLFSSQQLRTTSLSPHLLLPLHRWTLLTASRCAPPLLRVSQACYNVSSNNAHVNFNERIVCASWCISRQLRLQVNLHLPCLQPLQELCCPGADGKFVLPSEAIAPKGVFLPDLTVINHWVNGGQLCLWQSSSKHSKIKTEATKSENSIQQLYQDI